MARGKRVILVGVFKSTSTNVSQAESFERLDCEVLRYNYRQTARDLGGPRVRDDDLINVVRTWKPDIVVISKGNTINVRVVDEMKKMAKVVLWYMDPINGNWNNELKQKIAHCNITYCAHYLAYREAQKINPKSEFLHEGYDSKVDKPHDCKKDFDVSFIGNPDNIRNQYMRFGDIEWISAYGENHAQAVSASRINLNFIRRPKTGCSDRVYKILAAGGFLLTEPWPKMRKDFEPGKDLDIFESPEEMRHKIKYYLKNEEEREKIAKHGHETVKPFDRENWARRILGE